MQADLSYILYLLFLICGHLICGHIRQKTIFWRRYIVPIYNYFYKGASPHGKGLSFPSSLATDLSKTFQPPNWIGIMLSRASFVSIKNKSWNRKTLATFHAMSKVKSQKTLPAKNWRAKNQHLKKRTREQKQNCRNIGKHPISKRGEPKESSASSHRSPLATFEIAEENKIKKRPGRTCALPQSNVEIA